ncbi:MAG: DNA repair ATPase, partial [Planctomycetota bacterium]|nr:DNA repair ATPase [Planctomycetota bacterium]
MTDLKIQHTPTPAQENLHGGAYEVLRDRLAGQCAELRAHAEQLNARRKELFGGRELALAASLRVATEHACLARDLAQAGDRLLFGCDVFLGMKKETTLADVFSVFGFENGELVRLGLDFLADRAFEHDFRELYQYFKGARLQQLRNTGTHLLMVFQAGPSAGDVKVFRWALQKDGALRYAGVSSDRDQLLPPQHDFEWTRATREMHVPGKHPHVSIADLVFVECTGGDLTVKVENNAESGQGIYREPVSSPDQGLDDAEIAFAVLQNLVLLRIKPFNESAQRFLVFNRITQRVQRIDALGQACVQLPEGHGVVFPGGYLLQSGESKTFDQDTEAMHFQAALRSANGEDLLYVFRHREDGRYLLLPYNLIEKKAATPLVCRGYALLEDGTLVLVPNGHRDPSRSHEWQLWKSPFGAETGAAVADASSQLARIGNRDLVSGLSEILGVARLGEGSLPTLAAFENLARQTQLTLDRFHWLAHEECGRLDERLKAIRETGHAAIAEFEKAQRIRRETARRIEEFDAEFDADATRLAHATFEGLDAHVEALTALRARRGQAEGLRELRYADAGRLDALEARIVKLYDEIAAQTVQFLLTPEAFAPHAQKLDALTARTAAAGKSAETAELKAELETLAAGLHVLAEIVNGLPVDDPTLRTTLLDALSETCARQNRAKAALEARRAELLTRELSAEFAAQLKLLAQKRSNYLSLCDTPEKCDELLARVLAHIEEMDARFSEAGGFAAVVAEKREEAAAAFAARKQALLDERQRKAAALAAAAERILLGVLRRAASFTGADELHAYFASDPMVRKAREQTEQLRALGDRVKADELDARLKSARQEAGRALRDRLDLFEDGANVIRLGAHRFGVHTQPVDLSMVLRDGAPCLHIAGTDFYQPVEAESFAATRAFWEQTCPSEDAGHYRGAYLAWKVFANARTQLQGLARLAALDAPALLEAVRAFAQDRYDEAYERGVHDHDAAAILAALLKAHASAGLLAAPAGARALATLYWSRLPEAARKDRMARQARGLGRVLTQNPKAGDGLIDAWSADLAAFASAQGLPAHADARAAAAYLFHELGAADAPAFAVSAEAAERLDAFLAHLDRAGLKESFRADLDALQTPLGDAYAFARAWLDAFAQETATPAGGETDEETLNLLLTGSLPRRAPASVRAAAEGLLGRHATIAQGAYAFRVDAFLAEMERFDRETVPAYRAYLVQRRELLARERDAMQLDELKPKPLATFVRNRLIDEVYLPLIGANLAKQIGEAGDRAGADRMGMLLLISPPGYGKTTLMEYIANRLGLIFMKINGPALGHQVTSLDPSEATNAAAREELAKLNLALEMGDNVMLYVDDIQHCNPEFLQKFISLCDAQRKIEGVHKGRTRTYDLRGKKVAVVMAGNPYTESGEKFQIPDMLANRADTYNLGEIIGDSADDFETSYLENCLTSNPVLNQLAARSQDDVYAIIRMAQTGSREGIDLKGSFSLDEVNSMVNVMKKLLFVRDTVLTVNKEYIRSAGIHEDYRTEPAFKLQGSYRN